MECLGSIIFNAGKVDITDPCYDRKVWCRINDVEIEKGEYGCYYELSDDDRVAMICIEKVGEMCLDQKWERYGSIGVDAGLAGFFEDKPDYSDEEWYKVCDKIFAEEKDSGLDVHLWENGFFSSSGYGDGDYDVFCNKNREGKIVGLKIVFL